MMVLDSKNITVLMVDDDEINRQMAEMILTKKLPYKILTAESGMRGIELMHQFDVNLVLLDVDMPVWDGFKTPPDDLIQLMTVLDGQTEEGFTKWMKANQ